MNRPKYRIFFDVAPPIDLHIEVDVINDRRVRVQTHVDATVVAMDTAAEMAFGNPITRITDAEGNEVYTK